jgi:hypothetical protein
MMNNCSSILSVNQSKHKQQIQRNKGLFQGSILSPLLFNIFIDILAVSLATKIPSVKSLLFADDIEIKAKNLEEAQAALDICNNWSTEYRQIWGIQKCGVTHRLPKNYFPLLLGHNVLPVCKSYKYLGLPHDAYGIQWNEYLDKISLKTKRLIDAISPRKINWCYKTRLTIYKVFIRPCWEYCLPMLFKYITKTDKKLLKQIEELHKHGLEFIFDSRRSQAVLENLSGLGPLSHRLSTL